MIGSGADGVGKGRAGITELQFPVVSLTVPTDQ